MNCSAQVLEAVQWMERHLNFDMDQRVHVFELTIRAIGVRCTLVEVYVLKWEGVAILNTQAMVHWKMLAQAPLCHGSASLSLSCTVHKALLSWSTFLWLRDPTIKVSNYLAASRCGHAA